MKKARQLFYSFLFFCALFVFNACSRTLGYSVLLWNYPEENLQDGEIVRVFIRSNISQVYVIEIPGTKERREIPLWQITSPESKSKSMRTARLYENYLHTYAAAKIDGLPIRAEPSNVARGVYRLRPGEVIRILYEGNGQPVMAGEGVELDGKWLYVLTTDGTLGWCYSYNLALFETDEKGNRIGGSVVANQTEEDDEMMENILTGVWYPDNFRKLILDDTIDFSVLNTSHCFYVDTENNRVHFTTPEIRESWSYNGITKSMDTYQFNDIPISITFKGDNFIMIRYAPQGLRPKDFDFVKLGTPIEEILDAERERRELMYYELCEQSFIYRSSNYGSISFFHDGTFEWRDYDLLVPTLIPNRAGNTGTASINYVLSKELAVNYDGVITFSFSNTGTRVNFLFTMEEIGLRLEDASGVTMNGQIVTRRGLSPLVLFFSK